MKNSIGSSVAFAAMALANAVVVSHSIAAATSRSLKSWRWASMASFTVSLSSPLRSMEVYSVPSNL